MLFLKKLTFVPDTSSKHKKVSLIFCILYKEVEPKINMSSIYQLKVRYHKHIMTYIDTFNQAQISTPLQHTTQPLTCTVEKKRR